MSKNTIVHIDMGGSRISALAGVVLNDELKILGEQSRPSDDVKSGIVEKMTGAAYKINETTKLLQNALRIEPIASVSITVNAKSMNIGKIVLTEAGDFCAARGSCPRRSGEKFGANPL